MMKLKWTAWVSLLGLSLLFLVSEAAEEPKEKTRLPAKVQELDKARVQKAPLQNRIRMPVYKPPQRGAPGGRVGGGTRGGPG